MIPKVILQTSKEPYPSYVNAMWSNRIDSTWSVDWYDDEGILKFFKDNPLLEFPNVVEVFNSFKDGGHKADLFRYYYLYLNGGFFIDSDVMTHVHMNEIYSATHDHILVFADLEVNKRHHPELPGPIIFNGLMGCIPKSKIIYDALKNAYTVKTRVLEKQRLYFVYMLYVISEEHKHDYQIKYLEEQIKDNEEESQTIYNNKIVATHYYAHKVIPNEN